MSASTCARISRRGAAGVPPNERLRRVVGCARPAATALRDGECPVVWWDHELDEAQSPEEAAPSFLDWIETELRERAAEEPGSLLDNLGPMYESWMREWFKKR